MELTTTDILISICGLIVLVLGAASILRRLRNRARATADRLSRTDAHREWIRSVSTPAPEESGRHNLPDELLGGVTYRLSFDGRARAKVTPIDPGFRRENG